MHNLEQSPDTIFEQLAERLDAALTTEAIGRLKKKLADAVIDIGDELEYNLKDSLANQLAGHAQEMAEAAVNSILLGDDDLMRRFLKCTVGGYTGRDGEHHVIRGELYEQGGIELRKLIVDAHAELLKTERILDLESQVRSLAEQVATLQARNEKMMAIR